MAVLNRAQDKLKKLLAEMGLTPAARSRLAVKDTKGKGKSKWADLIAA